MTDHCHELPLLLRIRAFGALWQQRLRMSQHLHARTSHHEEDLLPLRCRDRVTTMLNMCTSFANVITMRSVTSRATAKISHLPASTRAPLSTAIHQLSHCPPAGYQDVCDRTQQMLRLPGKRTIQQTCESFSFCHRRTRSIDSNNMRQASVSDTGDTVGVFACANFT
jgi:hypothetical protein